MSELAQRTCIPCRGEVPPLTREHLAPLLEQLDPGWSIGERTEPARRVLFLERTYRFKTFAEAMSAAAAIGHLADAQQHHPDLHVAWGRLGIQVWTHKIGGLTESDFVFAAKCDAILNGAIA